MQLHHCLLLSACVAGSFLAACGDDPSPQSDAVEPIDPAIADALDATTIRYEFEEPTPYLRVDLRLTEAGDVAPERAARITLDREPASSMDLAYALVGRDTEGTVLTAVPVAFAAELHGTSSMADGVVHTSTTLATQHATAYLPENLPIASLTLLKNGSSTWELSADALAALVAEAERAAPPSRTSPLRRAALRDLDEKYPGIYFTRAGDEAAYAPTQLAGGSLVDIDDALAAAIDAALSQLAPALLASVTTLGVATWPGKAPAVASALGSRILLNAPDVLHPPAHAKSLAGTLIHEATHALVNLSGAASRTRAETEAWPKEVLDAMATQLAKHGIRTSLKQVWEDLHTSGFDYGYTGVFIGNKWRTIDDATSVLMGFATAYGSSSLGEDIAEYARAAAVDPEGALCSALAAKGVVPPVLAIPYAKLVLLRSVGAVTPGSFSGCVRGTSLVDHDGFSFADTPTANFSESLKAGWINDESGSSFAVIGSRSDSYRLMVEVALASPTASPLGLHRLDDISFWGLNDGSNRSGAYLADDDPLHARSSASGLVLITRAENDFKEGAIFGLGLQNVIGGITDRWAFGTFRTR